MTPDGCDHVRTDDEKVACRYLRHLRFEQIVYEPEFNNPPDFLINGRIAAEATRLNQRELSEDLDRRFRKNVRELLPSLGPPALHGSWLVFVDFDRSFPKWPRVRKALERHLRAFRDSPSQESTTIHVFDTLTLRLCPTNRLDKDCFVLGESEIDEEGLCVRSELERNIATCIDAKTRAVADVRAKYSEWWLLLVDHIGYGAEKESVRLPPHNWDRIILISPLDHTLAYELQ